MNTPERARGSPSLAKVSPYFREQRKKRDEAMKLGRKSRRKSLPKLLVAHLCRQSLHHLAKNESEAFSGFLHHTVLHTRRMHCSNQPALPGLGSRCVNLDQRARTNTRIADQHLPRSQTLKKKDLTSKRGIGRIPRADVSERIQRLRSVTTVNLRCPN